MKIVKTNIFSTRNKAIFASCFKLLAKLFVLEKVKTMRNVLNSFGRINNLQ